MPNLVPLTIIVKSPNRLINQPIATFFSLKLSCSLLDGQELCYQCLENAFKRQYKFLSLYAGRRIYSGSRMRSAR